MTESRLVRYIELIGGALIIKPVLSVFQIEIENAITQYLLGFVIAYILIEEIKRGITGVDKYLSKKIKEGVRKELKNAKKK